MAEHTQETRVVKLGGLVSSGTAVTGYEEVDYPSNSTLIIDALAVGTSWNIALSTGTATGAAGTAVSIGGANNVSSTSAGLVVYHLNDKLSKYVYYNVSGVGTGTVAPVLFNQGFSNSSTATTGTNVVTPTEA
jgi:hypothetical protein